MFRIQRKTVRHAALLLGAAALVAAASAAMAADPAAAAAVQTAEKAAPEALLRGPIHEAFAEPTALEATPGMIVPKKPPEPIDEVPPDVRPKGDFVSWIPGYWAWDGDANDFMWVSGVWRDAPPGRRWVPGYWSPAEGGWRWNSGMWVSADAQSVNYLPNPPASLENGPASDSPGPDYIWVSGCWTYRDNQYRWRPGYWWEGRPGWVWIDDHYVWTPRGVVFVGGYWDYPLSRRGTLFAPVAFRGAMHAGFRYTPSVVVDAARIILNMFVWPGYHHYCFGDFYGDEYARFGIRPWFEFHARGTGYDPLLSYYIWDRRRHGRDFVASLTDWHQHFLGDAALRPPRALADVGAFLDRNKGAKYVDRAVLGQTLHDVTSAAGTAGNFVRVTGKELQALGNSTGALRQLTQHRLGVESTVGGVTGTTGKLLGGPAGKNGKVLPGAGNVLRLPTIEEPLHRATSGAVGGTTGGAGRVLQAVPKVPALPNPGRALPGGILDGKGHGGESRDGGDRGGRDGGDRGGRGGKGGRSAGVLGGGVGGLLNDAGGLLGGGKDSDN